MITPLEWSFIDLLETLRLYAERYCHLAAHLQFVSAAILAEKLTLDANAAKVRELAEHLVADLTKMKADCESTGLEATRDEIEHILFTWRRHGNMEVFGGQCHTLAGSLERELKRHVCFILPRSSQVLYEAPMTGWEEILKVFPDATDDVEELNRCRAFGRHAASVFHTLLVVEVGLIRLGQFLRVTDPKQGWDATCKAIQRTLDDGYAKAPRHVQEHFAFLELVNKDLQSMKMAWRNKVSHAANKLVVITSDFKPQVAEKIITACNGFMLLLATEGPAIEEVDQTEVK